MENVGSRATETYPLLTLHSAKAAMVNMKHSSPRPELLVSYPSKGVVELKVEDWKLLGASAGRKRKQQAIDLVILFLFIVSWLEVSLSTLWER